MKFTINKNKNLRSSDLKNNSHSEQSGFTLIELLVVIAIISLLSSVVMFSVVKGREKALDAKRIEDMNRLEIDAQLALLEKTPIPIADNLDTHFYANNETGFGSSSAEQDNLGERVIKYIGILPESVYAVTSESLPTALNTNYKSLAPGQVKAFFRTGTVLPEDPQCDTTNAATCYRAWYDGNSLVIATTLRTRYHSSGNRVQYGIVVGNLNSTVLDSACKNMNFPVFDVNAIGSVGPVNPTCLGTVNGPASIIKGISNGRDFGGEPVSSGYGY